MQAPENFLLATEQCQQGKAPGQHGAHPAPGFLCVPSSKRSGTELPTARVLAFIGFSHHLSTLLMQFLVGERY